MIITPQIIVCKSKPNIFRILSRFALKMLRTEHSFPRTPPQHLFKRATLQYRTLPDNTHYETVNSPSLTLACICCVPRTMPAVTVVPGSYASNVSLKSDSLLIG